VFVHHGLFWADIQRVDSVVKSRLQALFQSNTNLYAAHLPLDAHPTLGNNVQLLQLLGLTNLASFGNLRGRKIGCKGTLPDAEPFALFAERVQALLGVPPLTIMPNGPESCSAIGVVSGGATANLVAEATKEGLDTLLVGEAGHSFFHLSKEYGLNVIGGGHYATETWGVKVVLTRLQEQFPDLQTDFVDLPTGL
jgi:dinuclear metal center YbgI/SA1388 family protein